LKYCSSTFRAYKAVHQLLLPSQYLSPHLEDAQERYDKYYFTKFIQRRMSRYTLDLRSTAEPQYNEHFQQNLNTMNTWGPEGVYCSEMINILKATENM